MAASDIYAQGRTTPVRRPVLSLAAALSMLHPQRAPVSAPPLCTSSKASCSACATVVQRCDLRELIRSAWTVNINVGFLNFLNQPTKITACVTGLRCKYWTARAVAISSTFKFK